MCYFESDKNTLAGKKNDVMKKSYYIYNIQHGDILNVPRKTYYGDLACFQKCSRITFSVVTKDNTNDCRITFERAYLTPEELVLFKMEYPFREDPIEDIGTTYLM